MRTLKGQFNDQDCELDRSGDVPTIVVVGGGFSGSMAAAQTLRRAHQAGLKVNVVLVERRKAIGEGVAYSTRETAHLLNVVACRMSAWPDDPDDFFQWALRRYSGVRPGDFLPRPWFGEYVRDSLLSTAEEVCETAKLDVVWDEVRCIDRHPSRGWMVHLGQEPAIRAEAVILAVGHRPPYDPIGNRWSGPRTRYLADSWNPVAMNAVGTDDAVVVIGTGLTAVDTVLSLTRHPRRAPITLVSRHGLLPHSHAGAPVAAVDMTSLAAELTAAPGGVRVLTLLRHLRRMASELMRSGGDWRSIVDGLRPHSALLWRAMPTAERRKFMTRLRPFWDVHRHRMAPAIAEPLRELLASGAVRVVAGHLESARAEGENVQLLVRPRGKDRPIELDARWVINCTGPLPSNSADSNPAIGSLLFSGELQPDELALGIESTRDGKPIAADGQPVADLFVVGPLLKSNDWESIAVPELRKQAAVAAEGAIGLLSSRFASSIKLAVPSHTQSSSQVDIHEELWDSWVL